MTGDEPEDVEGIDERVRAHKLERFSQYVRDTWAHLDRMCDLIAEGDERLRRELLLAVVVELPWA